MTAVLQPASKDSARDSVINTQCVLVGFFPLHLVCQRDVHLNSIPTITATSDRRSTANHDDYRDLDPNDFDLICLLAV